MNRNAVGEREKKKEENDDGSIKPKRIYSKGD